MRIYGAGMAGLLAAQMLRRFNPAVHEAQHTLPNNHAALLRFRSDAVSRVTGIPFKRVRVYKAVCRNDQVVPYATLRDNNEYSLKVTGEVANRSVFNLEPVERYIAPSDFIEQLSHGANITYGSELDRTKLERMQLGNVDPEPLISTIPMPFLMDMVGWTERPEFRYRSIWSVSVQIGKPRTDVYQTIYYPDHDIPLYRASLTGNLLTLEFASNVFMDKLENTVDWVLWQLGLVGNFQMVIEQCKEQKFGKLLPIDDRERRAFILGMTDKYRVYSLGRFGTWRQILMDDVVNDVQVIERFITSRSRYSRHIHYNTQGASA